ncbi:hypothetical protein K8353_12055 [Burkholderia contaminans]|nr:hypothetical protein [Burkholderia contaminans]
MTHRGGQPASDRRAAPASDVVQTSSKRHISGAGILTADIDATHAPAR